MHIKKIEIEGFKSYAQRQVVDNLDAQFNAITGLNGSGKSNILDSICFLLGITNLTQVRAHNLADLVYKQGQAGVSKATVTITFDNTDPKQTPIGYERCKEIIIRRQIIINGRNTYQINGTAATVTRVTDLFKMVGMNVNNPHFLIMQGRITKVLNMKPMEVLAMIEEAAGVRMYETKKQNALKTIEKKEVKILEIRKVMEEDIIPKVDKLKKDRSNFLEYQKLERAIEVLERKLVAYEFYACKRSAVTSAQDAEKKREQFDACLEEIRQTEEAVVSGEEEYRQMEAAKNNVMSQERQDLEERLKELRKRAAELESEYDGKVAGQKELQTNIERKKKSVKEDKKALAKKREELAKVEAEGGDEERRGNEAEEKVLNARKKLEALAKGMTTDEQGNAVTLEGQLTVTKTTLAQLETNVKKSEMKLKQMKPALEKKRAELAKLQRQSTNEEQEKAQLERDIQAAQNEMQQANFDEEAENNLEQERRELQRESHQLGQSVNQFETRYHYLDFRYEDPVPNFDRSRVKGVVAKLFTIRDPDAHATALEVAGGGQLSNIVIDSQETGKHLFKNGGLKRRVTFIPLDKINSRTLDWNRLKQELKRLGIRDGDVHLAKHLVDYDPELEPAMNSVFGNTAICSNMEVARKVAYESKIPLRSVTLEGDDISPSGTLTGGSRSKNACMLRELANMHGSFSRLEDIKRRVKQIEDEVRRILPLRQNFEQKRAQLHNWTRRLEVIVETMRNSPKQVLEQEVNQLLQEIPEHEKVITDARPEVDELKKKIAELEDRKKNEKAYYDSEKKKANDALKEAQKYLETMKTTFQQAKEKLSALREEIGELERTIAQDEAAIQQMEGQVDNGDGEASKAKEASEAAKAEVKQAQTQLEVFQKEARNHDKAMRTKAANIEELKKKIKKLEAQRDNLDRDAKDAKERSKNLEKNAVALEKKHPWIVQEKEDFGVQGGVYDFTGYGLESGKQELEGKKEKFKELGSRINAQAMQMLGNAEEKGKRGLEEYPASVEKKQQNRP
ncbi:Structural maintenance of chromosomes protein 2 [Aphelenchoides avenae]|nr:Structural maintenance of chromosomes protein 2 [Aphelenchus avenae]